MPRGLHDQITSFTQTETTINRWNNLSKLLLTPDKYEVKKIDSSLADSFRFDFFGLLKFKFNIPDEFLYPHLIVNKLSHPSEYDGETSIRIINPQSLAILYSLVK